jgi:hypothetical protein
MLQQRPAGINQTKTDQQHDGGMATSETASSKESRGNNEQKRCRTSKVFEGEGSCNDVAGGTLLQLSTSVRLRGLLLSSLHPPCQIPSSASFVAAAISAARSLTSDGPMSQDQTTVAASHHMRLHSCLAAFRPLASLKVDSGAFRYRCVGLVGCVCTLSCRNEARRIIAHKTRDDDMVAVTDLQYQQSVGHTRPADRTGVGGGSEQPIEELLLHPLWPACCTVPRAALIQSPDSRTSRG